MVNTKKFLVKNSDLFFVIGLCLGLFSFSWLDWSNHLLNIINSLELPRYILASVFLGLRYLSLFYIDKKHFFYCTILAVLLIISFFFSKTVYLIQCILMILLSYNINFKNIIRIVLFFSLLILITDLIGVCTGNINVFIASSDRYRCYMGFKHPSYFSIHLITIVFSSWLLFFYNKKVISSLVFVITGIFLWMIPNTRTSAIITILMPFFILASKKIVLINKKYINRFIYCVPVFLLLISLYLTFFINHSVLPETVSIRFSQALEYYQQCGIHLFKSSNLWLDNSYMFLLEHFGIVLTLMYLFLFIKVLIKCIKEKDYIMLSMSVALLIYSMLDNYVLNPRYNLSLFYLYSNTGGNKHE